MFDQVHGGPVRSRFEAVIMSEPDRGKINSVEITDVVDNLMQ